LEFAVLSNSIDRFVFANSEGGAYGENCQLPYQEDNISIDLGSPYYISKLSGEAYCKYYHKHYGLPISIVRLFNSYGPGEVSGQYRNVIPNFIYWALNKQVLPLTGDERIARDFVYVQDTVEGILRAGYFESAIGQSINIATGKTIKIYELAELINTKTENSAGVSIIGSRKWDQRPIICGDTHKAEELLEFYANTDFEYGLDKTIDWFKNNWTNIKLSAEFPPGKSAALDI
jgi:nucleoside-diphosphate-sugar epimerase